MKKQTAKGNRRKPGKPKPVEVPAEYGFISGDTPEPPDVDLGDGFSPSRLVKAWSALKLGLGVALVVCASLATAWAAHRFALTTSRFAVTDFQVEGNRRLSDGQLVRRAGIEAGQNLFAVDTDAAERKLLEDPWIRSARVSRRLPGTLRVELSEREAGAVAVIDEGLYLLSVDGDPFKPLTERDPHDLPIVTGLSARGFSLDRARELERAQLALEILRIYETIPLSRVYPAQEVHLAADGQVTVTVGSRPITLHLGLGPWRKKLLMAARVVGSLQAKGALPGVVFLDNQAHPERVVVRMR